MPNVWTMMYVSHFAMFKSIYPKTELKIALQILSASLTHISSFGDLKVYGRSRFPLFPPLQVVQELELWQCRAVAHHLLLSVECCLRMSPKTPAERRNMTSISVDCWITDKCWIWSPAFEFQDISVSTQRFEAFNFDKPHEMILLFIFSQNRWLSDSCTQLIQAK